MVRPECRICVPSCTVCAIMYSVCCHVQCVLSCTVCAIMYSVRPCTVCAAMYSVHCIPVDLVWSDPEEVDGWAISPRGAGYLFGDRVTSEVCGSIMT